MNEWNHPYEEENDDSLIDFLVMVITHSHKCQHCIHCFCGGCINAYDCIGRDFFEYTEGD